MFIIASDKMGYPGSSCSKLKMLLVNISLKLLIIKYGTHANIFAEFPKDTHIFSAKNTCEFDNVLTRTANILTTNELVKLSL